MRPYYRDPWKSRHLVLLLVVWILPNLLSLNGLQAGLKILRQSLSLNLSWNGRVTHLKPSFEKTS